MISSINYQSNVIENKIRQRNEKTNAKNLNTVNFKGTKLIPKAKDIDAILDNLSVCTDAIKAIIDIIKINCCKLNPAYRDRLKLMAKCDSHGVVPDYYITNELKTLICAFIKNPILANKLMRSSLKDGYVTWPEYSADAINLIVGNNITHPGKTKLLKKCLSRSYEFNDSNYQVVEIVNKNSKEKVQEALSKAGYQENKIYDYPRNFYSPHLFVKNFNKLFGK